MRGTNDVRKFIELLFFPFRALMFKKADRLVLPDLLNFYIICRILARSPEINRNSLVNYKKQLET